MPTRIDRCTLVGTEAAIRQARRALATCPWPPVGDAEVVILRRIETRARPAALPARLYQATDRLLATRVDGWSAAAESADCVCFRSEAELLGRLSLDLAAGRARGLWFWQAYRRWVDDPAGLARLWLDHAPRLPALCRVLTERRGLAPVWRAVDAGLAAALLPRLAPAGLLADLRGQPAADAGRLPAADLALVAAARTFSVSPIAFAEPDHADADRALLALLLTVAALRPHWLASPRAVGLIAPLRSALAADLGAPTSVGGAASAAPGTPASAGPLGARTSVRVPVSTGTPAADRRLKSPIPAPASAGAAGSAAGAGAAGGGAATGADLREPGESGQASARGTAGAADAAEAGAPINANLSPGIDAQHAEPGPSPEPEPTWQVEQGGLFFLINVLNHPVIRARLYADAEAMAFPSGWGWLLRLGEAMGLAPEPALTRCLAALAGLPAERFVDELPPLGLAPEILAWAEQRFRGQGIGWPAVLTRPARLDYRRPELDIVLRMADLDLAVRRVGLDIDPGWVEWLGTVVRFHYRGGAGWSR